MVFLISNDDGINAQGLQSLALAVESLGEVYVVAPHRERSTAGHSLTLHKPLRVFEHGNRRFSTSGSPADCVYLGTREILKQKPDLVLSGINHGANLGTDVHYSGTVAAAREAAVMDIRSIAFSLVDFGSGYTDESFRNAAVFAKKVVEISRDFIFPKNSFLNVNIPNINPADVKGVRLARQGLRFYSGDVVKRQDPRGRDYYWIGGSYKGFEPSDVSDCHVVQEGWISLTPISLDATHNDYYTTLAGGKNRGKWEWNSF
jgi:5'-nucleotidase